MTVGAINDGSAATLAEFTHGAGQDAHDLVLLTLGTGVGGGFVLDGQLYRGWAEVGHMVIVENGEPCQGACTGRGHVESYCSGHAADRLARAALGPTATARDLVEQRHPALTEIGRHLGAAIASLVNLFDPDMVLIGGGFGVAAADLLLEPAREVVRREALAPAGDHVRARRGRARAGCRRHRRGARRVRGAGVGGRMPLAVCATPIGNLADVTLRVLDELREADLVLCEDTRHTRILLARHSVSARLLSLHEHNEAERIRELIPRLVAGERIALVSDAGLPGISDPGSPLVRAALSAGVPVTVLPGPSAVETALVASGLLSDRYAFVGFLPRRAGRARVVLGGARELGVAGRGVRVSETVACDAAVAGRGRAVARGSGLPRADEEVRAGRARDRGRAGRAVRRAPKGRDHPGARRCVGRRRTGAARRGGASSGRSRRRRDASEGCCRGRSPADGCVAQRALPLVFVTRL